MTQVAAHNPLTELLERSSIPKLPRIADYLDHWAAQKPDQDAVSDSRRRLTWRQLSDEVDLAANALRSLGAKGDARVAMLGVPNTHFWVALLACARLGVMWLGLNPRHTLDELTHVINDASPVLLLHYDMIDQRDFGHEVRALAAQFPQMTIVSLGSDTNDKWNDFLGSHAGPVQKAKSAPAKPFLLVYTSGTTGKPKGAMISDGAIARGVWAHASIWRVAPYRIINNLPINHIGCVIDIGCTCLAAGGYMALAERFDAEGSLSLIQREKLTLWGQVPTQFILSLGVPNFSDYDLGSLKLILWSGARASTELLTTLRALAPQLATSYSMTETVGSVTLTPPTDDIELLDGTIGWPDPERQMKLSPDGEILVRDPYLMSGYLGLPDATAAAYVDGWFRTGDIAEWRADGTLSLKGRAREMFKSGGYNVYPKEVEEAIERHPSVVEAVVVPRPDPVFGEVGEAFVRTTGDHVTEANLTDHARTILANYKIPKRIYFMANLPMLPIGKVDRNALARIAANNAEAGTDPVVSGAR
jgi:acyl-CoA synthetase (AMP-forming)/AMP-acid ligase II